MNNYEPVNRNNDIDVEINFLELCKSLLKRLWILLLAAAVAGSFAFFAVKSTESNSYISNYKNYFYTNDNLIEVNAGNIVSTPSTMDVPSLMQIYYYVATDSNILQRVNEKAELNLSAEEIKSMLSIDIDDKNTIVSVTVCGETPEEVYSVAETLNELAGAELMEKIEGCQIETIVSPSEPEIQVSGRAPVKYAVLAALLAFIITAVVIAVVEIAEDKVKNPVQLEERSGILVLGCIPDGKKLSCRKV